MLPKGVKYFLIGLVTIPALLAVLYCGKWSYDRLSIAEQIYAYLVGPPAKGLPSRATTIDNLYTHPPVDAATVRELVKEEVKAELAAEKVKK